VGIDSNKTVLYGAINTTFECQPDYKDAVQNWTRWSYEDKYRRHSRALAEYVKQYVNHQPVLVFYARDFRYKVTATQGLVLVNADMLEAGTFICTTEAGIEFYGQLVVIRKYNWRPSLC